MAEKQFKKMQVGPAVSYVKADLGIKIDDIEVQGGGDGGKTWSTIELTEEEVRNLAHSEQIVRTLEKPFDVSQFDKSYLKVNFINEANLTGAVIYAEKEISKVFADFTTPVGGTADWTKEQIVKTLSWYLSDMSFDHHYYSTSVILAGMDEPEEGRKPILEGKGVIDGKNVVYIQDVSQQAWEKNTEPENEIVKVKSDSSREGLDREIMGNAYVIHIKGDTQEFNALFCYVSSQGSYLSNGKIAWTDIEEGKIYKVTFDSSSEYWVLTMGTDGKPVEYTQAELIAVRDNGIAFEADKFSAYRIVDTATGQYGECLGNENSNLNLILSYNKAFSEDHSEDLEVIGRPVGRIPGVFSWYDEEEEEWIYCENGAYVWNVVIQAKEYTVFIPDDEDHKNILVIYAGSIASGAVSTGPSYQSIRLYRHTFNLTSTSTSTGAADQYKCMLSFCAVNAQQGDSNIEYVLHSDESEYIKRESAETTQNIDWMLPVSGTIGILEGSTVNNYTAVRIVATWEPDNADIPENPTLDTGHRVLKVRYIGSDFQPHDISLITDNTKDNYRCTDFRSVIASVATVSEFKSYDVLKIA